MKIIFSKISVEGEKYFTQSADNRSEGSSLTVRTWIHMV